MKNNIFNLLLRFFAILFILNIVSAFAMVVSWNWSTLLINIMLVFPLSTIIIFLIYLTIDKNSKS